MKEVKKWLRQEFRGFGPHWRNCRCGARLELKVNSKGVRYLKHPTGNDADRAHKGLFPYGQLGDPPRHP